MSVKSFINKVKHSLGLTDFKENGKKKSVKALLRKLCERKELLTKTLKKMTSQKERKEFEEELDIITRQIKKGEKILAKLKNK